MTQWDPIDQGRTYPDGLYEVAGEKPEHRAIVRIREHRIASPGWHSDPSFGTWRPLRLTFHITHIRVLTPGPSS